MKNICVSQKLWLPLVLNGHGSKCWLINTGLIGGGYGKGRRIPLDVTRKILAAVLDGQLRAADMQRHEIFEIEVPISIAGIEDSVLDPKKSWNDPAAYMQKAESLKSQFDAVLRNIVSHD